MYQCPNCGGEMKFDIASQQMKCGYCKTLADPYRFEETSGASGEAVQESAEDKMEVTQFVCPQCGGVIVSRDNTAAAFCSYCGASAVLTPRVTREKRPDAIIPFQKTKEDCAKSYKRLVSRAIFAPKELKDASCIDSFRGIYMPYWVYDVQNTQDFSMEGKIYRRQGDYDVTEHYNLTGHIDASYQGITHDASTEFADDISECIAPYNVRKMKDFNAAFLSGFYADTADTREKIYRKDVRELTTALSNRAIADQRDFRKYDISSGGASLFYDVPQPHYAMFPVWFMSYRKGDRVAYATVNGQTGRAAADLPVDIKKYVAGSLLLAVPIFFLLNFLVFFNAHTVLGVAAFFAILTALLSVTEHGKVVRRESGVTDRGRQNRESGSDTGNVFVQRLPSALRIRTFRSSFIGIILELFTSVFAFLIIYLSLAGALGFSSAFKALLFLVMVILLIYTAKKAAGVIKMEKKSRKEIKVRGAFGFTGSLSALAIAVVIFILNPVSDYFYYGGAMACAAAISVTIVEIIKDYNMLSTRALPQFKRKGGDDRAK